MNKKINLDHKLSTQERPENKPKQLKINLSLRPKVHFLQSSTKKQLRNKKPKLNGKRHLSDIQENVSQTKKRNLKFILPRKSLRLNSFENQQNQNPPKRLGKQDDDQTKETEYKNGEVLMSQTNHNGPLENYKAKVQRELNCHDINVPLKNKIESWLQKYNFMQEDLSLSNTQRDSKMECEDFDIPNHKNK